MDGFKEVVPGVIVSAGLKIKIPHPDPVWVIRNEEETGSLTSDEGPLFVFSSEELANKYMEKRGVEGGFPKCFTWDECVDKFSQSFSDVFVDPSGEPGFCSNVPLRKGI